MNVIRMIKLFGWEPQVAAQMSEKREEELEFVKKNKLLDLVNGNVKYVFSSPQHLLLMDHSSLASLSLYSP